MRLFYFGLVVGTALSMVTEIQPRPAISATLLSADKAAQVITVRNVTIKEGAVSGELVNKSHRVLRDVQLLIRYTWIWKDEYRPGKDDPGMAVYYTVEREIPPDGTIPFTYRPSQPLPSRADGYFEVAVSVAGYTEVVQ